jgi:hypothetical protein
LVSYEKEKDIDNKITKILKITGITNNNFKPNNVQKGTRIKLYTTLALPVLLYGSETWTVKSKDKSTLAAAEMRFMCKTAKYTWSDHKTNEEIYLYCYILGFRESMTYAFYCISMVT